MAVPRQVKESPLHQGEDERIAYDLTTTPWGSTPTSVVVVLKNMSAGGTDISGTNLSGAAGTVGDIITTPLVISLTAGVNYRLEIQFVVDGNTLETYLEIEGQL